VTDWAADIDPVSAALLRNSPARPFSNRSVCRGSDVLLAEADAQGGTTVRPLTFDASKGLKLSDALARGWIDG
jgi:hypothetical protein